MAATSTWQPAYDFTATIGGITPFFESCEVSEEVEDFETTNQVSAGDHEFGVAVTTRRVRGSYFIDTGDRRNVALKTLGAASYSDGTNSFSGQFRVIRRSRTGAGKGGMKFSFEGKFTGAVTVS